MKHHPASQLFPMMERDELRKLADDIAEHGLRQPIVVHEEQILDGRNRWAACELVGVNPMLVEWRENGSAAAYVLSANLHRRHLTTTQKAMIAATAEAMFAEEGRRRMSEGGKKGGLACPTQSGEKTLVNHSKPLCPNAATSDRIRSRESAAKTTGVSPAYVGEAKRLRKDAPAVAKLAESGLVNLHQARQLSKLDEQSQGKAADAIRSGQEPRKVLSQLRVERKRRIAEQIRLHPDELPVGQYRVVVIDPPWAYDQSVERSTKAVRGLVDYPDMSVEQLCKLPVGNFAYRDCVLWLWTTNSHMRHAFTCLDAWGFTEKTILTWDKVDMGVGYYLRNVTEHCILAVKGHPVFDHATETTLLREKRREHSRKPEAFYNIVDALCPGKRLEIFARQKREGYDVWGAETDKFDG